VAAAAAGWAAISVAKSISERTSKPAAKDPIKALESVGTNRAFVETLHWSPSS